MRAKFNKNPYLFAVISVFLWSTVASFFKLALRQIDYIQLLFFASIVSTLALFIVISLQKKLYPLLHCSRRDIFRSFLMGILNPFIYYLILFKAYSILPAQEAQPLNYTWPIVLSILSVIFLGQKMHIKSYIAIVLSFIGVMIISTGGHVSSMHFSNITGDILAVSSSVIWASFWILNVKDKREPEIKLFMSFLFSLPATAIILLLLSKPIIPCFKVIVFVIYIGLFEMGLTFLVWLKALQLSKNNASISNIIYLSPFISLIFIHYIVGEHILLSSIMGLAFIVGGIVIQQLYTSK